MRWITAPPFAGCRRVKDQPKPDHAQTGLEHSSRPAVFILCPTQEWFMADDNGGGAGNTLLAIIVGGILVVVVALFAFGGFPGMQHKGSSLTINAPANTR